MTHTLSDYQSSFVDFLVESEALQFGEFTLKSGRKAPYFINTGRFNDGARILRLGEYYARHIERSIQAPLKTVFGPAYKGIPLAVATAGALFSRHNRNVGFSFDRKEAKDHGDAGKLVGMPIEPGDPVVIVEDVITAGTTLREIVPYLRSKLSASVCGVIVAVDRCERGTSELSAVAQARQELDIEIFPLVTVHQIIEHLSKAGGSKVVLAEAQLERMRRYLQEYGA